MEKLGEVPAVPCLLRGGSRSSAHSEEEEGAALIAGWGVPGSPLGPIGLYRHQSRGPLSLLCRYGHQVGDVKRQPNVTAEPGGHTAQWEHLPLTQWLIRLTVQ